MRDQVLWRKTGRIAALLAERLDIDTERALDLLYNSRTYAMLTNPESGLQLLSDEYILTDLMKELEEYLSSPTGWDDSIRIKGQVFDS